MGTLKKSWIHFIKHAKAFFHFIKIWSDTIGALVMALSMVYVVISTEKNLNFLSETLKSSNEQLRLQKKSIPAQFIMSYKNINTYSEQAFIANTGKTNIKEIRTEWEYYFIDSNDKIYSGSNMRNITQTEIGLLSKIVNNKFFDLINEPSDFDGLFGTGRSFDISYLKANTTGSHKKSETLLDISSSSIQNALKLNKILETEMFVRWKIKYKEELSNKEVITYKYIWVTEGNALNKAERKDLQDVVGGKRIIELISNYEHNTKEVIFRTPAIPDV